MTVKQTNDLLRPSCANLKPLSIIFSQSVRQSIEGTDPIIYNTHMQLREPPWKDILSFTQLAKYRGNRALLSHRLEYTPGIRASSTARGRGERKRSGFHSCASSPQMALFVLHARRLRIATVSLGTVTSVMRVPSFPRTGS